MDLWVSLLLCLDGVMVEYNFFMHSMSDLGSTYRTRDEITGVRQVGYPGRIGIWEASLS